MNKTNEQTTVVFVGGETAGPVIPLIALADAWREKDGKIQPLFLDVRRSISAHMVPKHGYEFRTMTSGKLRRYWSVKNIFSPLLIVIGLLQSLLLLVSKRPKAIVGAGGYVQVPVIIAGWLLRVPTIIHQQDIVPTFSNRLVAPLATKITTTFEKSTKDFSQGSGFEKNFGANSKIVWTGNPSAIKLDASKTDQLRQEGRKLFKLDSDWPTVLVIGGGSGAVGLNQAVAHSLPELLKVSQIIHSTGIGKGIKPPADMPMVHDRYRQFEFIDNMELAYAAANIVIARAGIGSITELSALGKVSIIVPMPNSHQEWNAHYLYEKNAAVIIDQTDITPDMLAKTVRKILFDAKLQTRLQSNIHKIMPNNATERMLEVIQNAIHGD